MTLKEKRQQVWQKIAAARKKANTASLDICVVTKGHTTEETQQLLHNLPEIKIIGENRWPDCEEKFLRFKNLQRHFIGPLQSNKVRKVVPLIDQVQSVDSFALLEKLDRTAGEFNKMLQFCIQVNISKDAAKNGISPEALPPLIENYLAKNFKNLQLKGLMTIGENSDPETKRKYFRDFKKLFDKINRAYFKEKSLPTLSMGMSEDFEMAIEEGATMIRIGSILW